MFTDVEIKKFVLFNHQNFVKSRFYQHLLNFIKKNKILS